MTELPRGDQHEDRQPGSLEALARAAAELLAQTIRKTDPAAVDFKEVKQLTGALKDLAELMAPETEEKGGGIVIRIEGDEAL